MGADGSNTNSWLSKNSYVSIGLVVLLLGVTALGERRMTEMETQIENHINNPLYHENIITNLQHKYVTREELNSKIENMDDKLERIEKKIDTWIEYSKKE